MRKCFLFLLILAVVFVSCKSKVKVNVDSIDRDTPPTVEANQEQGAAYQKIYSKLKDFVNSDDNLKIVNPLNGADGLKRLAGKTLIYKGVNVGQWLALGVSPNSHDVFVGRGDNLPTALSNASKESNWDSRKLFYYISGDNVRLSWAARIGKPNNGTFTEFNGFDARDGIPQGYDKIYSTVQAFDQVFMNNVNGVNYYEKLSSEEKNNAGNKPGANFIIEVRGNTVGSDTKRKAWMWDFWSAGTFQVFDEVGVRIVKPEKLRFGYTTGTGNNWFPASTGTQNNQLTELKDSGMTYTKTTAPNGKTIFTRSIDGSKNWNYAVNQAVFLATVVGYNIRVVTTTPKTLGVASDELFSDKTGWDENTTFDIVVMEFDGSASGAYHDAKFDDWNDAYDSPNSDVKDKAPLNAENGISGSEVMRVYFIVAK